MKVGGRASDLDFHVGHAPHAVLDRRLVGTQDAAIADEDGTSSQALPILADKGSHVRAGDLFLPFGHHLHVDGQAPCRLQVGIEGR